MNFYLILATFFAYTLFRAAELVPQSVTLGLGLGTLLFAAVLSAMFLTRLAQKDYDTWWFKVIAWGGSLLLGLWGSFLLLSIPFEVVRLLLWVTLPTEEYHQYFYLASLSLFWASVVIAVIGLLQVLRGPVVRRVEAAVPNLAHPLTALKIVQISDLHIGPTIRGRFIRKVIDRVNRLDADIILLTGDIVDSSVASVRPHIRLLKELKSKHGVFYVTGNHEYYWGVAEIIQEIAKLGIQVLINENRVVTHNGVNVLIAGITDPMGLQLGGRHIPDVKKAAATPYQAGLKILLAHRPGVFNEVEAAGFNLQFSGHTHAGQFFPFSLLIPFAHKYSRGLYAHNKLWVYVNPGTGYWGPANRFGIPPEITELQVVPST